MAKKVDAAIGYVEFEKKEDAKKAVDDFKVHRKGMKYWTVEYKAAPFDFSRLGPLAGPSSGVGH